MAADPAIAELEQKIARLETLRALEVAKATGRDPWTPEPHQVAPPGDWYLWLLLAGRGAGKLLHDETPLATPSGWTSMGEVEPGDVLFDETGNPTRVIWKSERQTVEAYRVTFSDGSTVLACADHLWTTWTHSARKALLRSRWEQLDGGTPDDWPTWRSRKRIGGWNRLSQEVVQEALALAGQGVSWRGVSRRTGIARNALSPHLRAGSYVERLPSRDQEGVGPRTITTSQIADTLRHGKRGDLNHSIPTCAPLELPDADLPIDPYVLGYWLGDGSSHGGGFTIHPTDQPHFFARAAAFSPRQRPSHPNSVGTTGLHRLLRSGGLIRNKHIPSAYLRGSIAQRQALLQGLMDSDGHAAGSSVEFVSTTDSLALGVVELARSLGQKPLRATSPSYLYGRRCKDKHRVTWRPTLDVFLLPRKLADVRPLGSQSHRSRHRMIVAVEPTGVAVPMHCIAVDSPHSLYLAGSGMIPTHNTDACASYFDRFMRRNPGARGGIVAPTLGDAAESCVYGASGLMVHNPLLKMRSRAGGTHVVWPNGAEAKLFGAYTREDVERLRAGGNRHLYWGEEVAAWRNLRDAWENMELGLRLGVRPHIVASTTPKTRPKLKELMDSPETALVRASIHDNPHLPDVQRQRLLRRYAGTRLERQELLGEYLEDVEGALWTFETIAACRVLPVDVPDLARVVVGVDPSGGDEDGNDEQGIVVAGKGVDGHGYVLADRSCKLSPDGWGKRAVQAYDEFDADRVVGETNFGGDLVIQNIKVAARALGIEVATKKLTASRGKVARAEPIAALYEQGRIHHVGEFPELESQLRNWTAESGWSPDRLDGAVWTLTELLLGGNQGGPARVSSPAGYRVEL